MRQHNFTITYKILLLQIPIGSGKTLVPRDKFRRIKWTSYTVATRGLLLAVFPRRYNYYDH